MAYTLDTEDKRLVDEAVHVVGEGSIRKLAAAIGLSESRLRHVLSGRTDVLDTPTRRRIRHLMARSQAQAIIVERLGDRWATANRFDRVVDHILTCPVCLAASAVAAEAHFKLVVARVRQND